MDRVLSNFCSHYKPTKSRVQVNPILEYPVIPLQLLWFCKHDWVGQPPLLEYFLLLISMIILCSFHSSHQLPLLIFPLFISPTPPSISTLMSIMNLTINIQSRFVTYTLNLSVFPISVNGTTNHSHCCSSQKPVNHPCCLPPFPSLPTCSPPPASPVSLWNIPKSPPFLSTSTASYLAPRPPVPAWTFLTSWQALLLYFHFPIIQRDHF